MALEGCYSKNVVTKMKKTNARIHVCLWKKGRYKLFSLLEETLRIHWRLSALILLLRRSCHFKSYDIFAQAVILSHTIFLTSSIYRLILTFIMFSETKHKIAWCLIFLTLSNSRVVSFQRRGFIKKHGPATNLSAVRVISEQVNIEKQLGLSPCSRFHFLHCPWWQLLVS